MKRGFNDIKWHINAKKLTSLFLYTNSKKLLNTTSMRERERWFWNEIFMVFGTIKKKLWNALRAWKWGVFRDYKPFSDSLMLVNCSGDFTLHRTPLDFSFWPCVSLCSEYKNTCFKSYKFSPCLIIERKFVHLYKT